MGIREFFFGALELAYVQSGYMGLAFNLSREVRDYTRYDKLKKTTASHHKVSVRSMYKVCGRDCCWDRDSAWIRHGAIGGGEEG